MIKGKCLCGNIRYQVKGEPHLLYNCHCVNCRGFTGASFATFYLIDKSQMLVDDPDNSLVQYNSSEDGIRSFCRSCGASLFSDSTSRMDYRAIHSGSVQKFPEISPSQNFYIAQKCPWVELDQKAKNYQYSAKG